MASELPIQVGPYCLVERIAVGGMAEVFRAESSRLGGPRTVAYKRIHHHLLKEQLLLDLFDDEAKLMSEIQHRNIIQVFDHGRFNDHPFMAMEFVVGRNLRQVMDRAKETGQALKVHHILRIAEALCGALDYAHHLGAHGAIHCDIAPKNVMVSMMGEIKLTDFGVAFLKHSGSHALPAAAGPASGDDEIVKGTYAYMSPEQARGQALDARSDVFSLGVLVWELLCGRSLFAGETVFSTINNLMTSEPGAPSRYNPEVSSELDELVIRCLAPTPEDRPKSCLEIANAIKACPGYTPASNDCEEIRGLMASLFADDEAVAAAHTAPKKSAWQWLTAAFVLVVVAFAGYLFIRS